jgi:TDG/mug DNA glycosylase family protein
VNEELPLQLAHAYRAGATEVLLPRRADIELLLAGAGFEPTAVRPHGSQMVNVTVARLRTIPDIVGPSMRVLMCGLNPSLYAADQGVNFARPGNRLWPAALAAGLVTRDRDPFDALETHGVGWTDLVKRATVGAAEIGGDEYRVGVTRLRRVVEWLAPRVVCFIGLAGWRAAIDRRATAGVQSDGFAGAAAYLMPNTSGLNARSQHTDFVDHLTAVAAMAGPERSYGGCVRPH